MTDPTWPLAGRKVRAKPAQHILAPAFLAFPPRIRNPELIDVRTRRVTEPIWTQTNFPQRAIEVFDLQGAYITEECLILDRDLHVIENASDSYTDSEIAEAVEAVKAAELAQKVPRFPEPGIVSKRRAASNYGHFMIDMLPMALLGLVHAGNADAWFVAHHTTAQVMDATLRAFRLAGVPLSRVLMPGARSPLWFDRLIVVRGLTQHGLHMSRLALLGADRLGQMVAAQGGLPDRRFERLFIRRVPAVAGHREMHNEAEVERRLAARGFIAIEPGALMLEDQIRAFASARHVVGVGGAAMTNIAFCQPGTKVTMLWPASFPDVFFWFLCVHRGLDCLDIRGDQRRTEGDQPWLDGFTLREADIRYLESL